MLRILGPSSHSSPSPGGHILRLHVLSFHSRVPARSEHHLARDALLLLLLCAGPRAASGQNLLTNGDFSNIGTITLNNGYAAVGAGTLIPGWTTTIGNANNANVYVATSNSGATWIPNPQSPPYSVQLDSTSNDPLGTSSTIRQTITVTAGQSYLLSFWFTTEVKPNLTSIIQVTLTGRGGFTSTNSYSTTAPANITQANAVWVHVTQTFTPTRSGNFTVTLRRYQHVGQQRVARQCFRHVDSRAGHLCGGRPCDWPGRSSRAQAPARKSFVSAKPLNPDLRGLRRPRITARPSPARSSAAPSGRGSRTPSFSLAASSRRMRSSTSRRA